MLLVILCAVVTTHAAVPVKLFENYNQALHVANPGGTSKGGTIVSLGRKSSLDDCKQSCLGFKKRRCWSFVHKKPITNAYKIRSTQSNKTLHANDGPAGDRLVSTRFQTDDGYSLFGMENVVVSTDSKYPPKQAQAVRIRVSKTTELRDLLQKY